MSLDLCVWANRDDKAVGDQYCAILYETNVGKRSATAGAATTQS
jgi:hypothetical protein